MGLCSWDLADGEGGDIVVFLKLPCRLPLSVVPLSLVAFSSLSGCLVPLLRPGHLAQPALRCTLCLLRFPVVTPSCLSLDTLIWG